MNVAVVGAAGYSGIEAIRWVLAHPELRLTVATSTADAGRGVADLYPALSRFTELEFTEPDTDAIIASAQVALLAVPHTAAMAIAPALLDAGVTVFDLSADFRLNDPDVYSSWYGTPHTAPELLSDAVYGLPELHRTALRGAKLVACPGCYPTATALAALPLLSSGAWAGGPVLVDAKSGVSGAGRSPQASSHFVSANESVTPYKVGSHRHTPEIEQTLSTAAGTTVDVLFTPHLVPMTRGLLSTVYLSVIEGFTTADALALYRAQYDAEPFVRVAEPPSMPSTSEVAGTNRAVVGLHVDERSRTLVAACAIDNLGKGAAGQAIQCLNVVFGYPETAGLDTPPAVV